MKDYPAIKRHLDQYWDKISTRADKGDTPYNLRSCAYMDDFSRQKLLWAETMRIRKDSDELFPRFSYSEDTVFTDKTCFIATGKNLLYVLSVLNSHIGRYQLMQTVSMMDNGGYLMQKIYLEQIRIPPTDKGNIDPIERLACSLLSCGGKKSDGKEKELNELVLDLYHLSRSERKYLDELFKKPVLRG